MATRQRSRVTDPTALQPPGQIPAAADDAGTNHYWLWIALAGLLLLGLVVILVLPALVSPTHEATAPSQDASPQAVPTTQDTVAVRDAAQQTLQDYLQLRARLELENAAVWGESRLNEAAAQATAGDRQFAQRQFAAAGRHYQEALMLLQQLEANRAQMLAAALDQATRALTENDTDTAIAGYQRALSIEPDHPVATRGLAQANTRQAVLGQMNRAQQAEAAGDLQTAQSGYQHATQLDADYAPATEALARVTQQINTGDFNQAMTTALAALDAGQTGNAAKALAEAERLQPGNSAVRDARLRLQGMRAQAGLQSLRRQATDKVASEDWTAAIALYRKALAIDPAAGFASEGLRRAQGRSTLHGQIDHYLDKPTRIYSATPLANAQQLLAAAGEVPTDEPRLAGKVSALRELVSSATVPQSVTLRSDGKTRVVVYHVGDIGQFNDQQLELLPGDYTVVGKRPGYRDVRRTIMVRPGVALPPLVVRCEEQI